MDTFQTGKQKQKAGRWRPSILVYFIVMNFILLCLLFPTLAFYFFRQEISFQNNHLENMIVQMRLDIKSRSSSMVQSLALSAGQAIAGFNFSFLNTLINRVVSENPEIVYTYIMDTNRKILAHNNPKEIGQTPEDMTSIRITELKNKIYPAKLNDEARPMAVQFFDMNVRQGPDSVRVLEAVTAVYSGGSLAGFLRCGYSLAEMDSEITTLRQEWAGKIDNLKFSFMAITILFFLVGAGVAFLFTQIFVRSMRVLSDGVGKISRGDLNHRIKLDGLATREFTHLSNSFNVMTEKLRTSYEQLEQYSRNLESKVEERTRDLQTAQANLLRQAHEAGMAEMAVGILHNIGNAITPAKVSTALLIKRMKESGIRRHIKEMMQDFNHVIADPAGVSQEDIEKLKQITEVLPNALLEEYAHIVNEVEKVRDKHDHIESIIHLQLRYARLMGDIENVNANKVVADALEMLEESITKYSVTVDKKLDPDLPFVRIEQPKLLQVIINLVKNAVEAMRDIDPGERQLVIATTVDTSGQFVKIAIKDNGMGFEPEDREKLFSYGYTTKKHGSGFGLHSCANFLIANNGTLEATSNGPGTGAEFIVRLPLATIEVNDEEERKQNDK
jgi:signal transduction histidine kinase